MAMLGETAHSEPGKLLTDLDVEEGKGGQGHVICGRRQLKDVKTVVILCNLQAEGEDASGFLAWGSQVMTARSAQELSGQL